MWPEDPTVMRGAPTSEEDQARAERAYTSRRVSPHRLCALLSYVSHLSYIPLSYIFFDVSDLGFRKDL